MTEFRVELLGRLGLRASASDQDVERAHDELVDFLELAPRDMRSWATARTTDVDEAFALLSGPDEDLVPPAALAAPVVTLDKPETPVPAAAPVPTAPPADSTPAEPADPQTPASPFRWLRRRTYLLWAILPLLIVVVVLGVYRIGKTSSVPGISGTPTNAATTSAATGPTAVPVDQTKVAALTKKVTANPKDIASMQSLGDLYFAALDFKNASIWEQKILVVDPKNEKGLISLGAAQFNVGNKPEAKKQWSIAAGLYPLNAEVHYDLGFYYMSQKPPETANMKAEWAKVVAIDPNSELAKSVQTVISGTKPTASTAPSAK